MIYQRFTLLVLLSAFFLLLAQGSSSRAQEPSTPPVSLGVTVQRPDNTQLPIAPIVRIWCGPFDENNRKKQAIHLVLGSQKLLGQDGAAMLDLAAVMRDIKRRRTIKLPNTFTFNKAKGASLFIVDGKNEFSAQTEQSSGSLVFRSATCSPYPNVEVEFRNVAVGSELANGPVLRVNGTLNTKAL